jgi:hypothetical protein
LDESSVEKTIRSCSWLRSWETENPSAEKLLINDCIASYDPEVHFSSRPSIQQLGTLFNKNIKYSLNEMRCDG